MQSYSIAILMCPAIDDFLVVTVTSRRLKATRDKSCWVLVTRGLSKEAMKRRSLE